MHKYIYLPGIYMANSAKIHSVGWVRFLWLRECTRWAFQWRSSIGKLSVKRKWPWKAEKLHYSERSTSNIPNTKITVSNSFFNSAKGLGYWCIIWDHNWQFLKSVNPYQLSSWTLLLIFRRFRGICTYQYEKAENAKRRHFNKMWTLLI